MRTKQLFKGIAAAAVGAGISLSAHAAQFTGAGATFPFPIYAKWAEAYKASSGIGPRSVPPSSSATSASIPATSASEMPCRAAFCSST